MEQFIFFLALVIGVLWAFFRRNSAASNGHRDSPRARGRRTNAGLNLNFRDDADADDFVRRMREIAASDPTGSVKVIEPAGRKTVARQRPSENIEWEPEFSPTEVYEIEYSDRHGEYSERTVHLLSFGRNEEHEYYKIVEDGKLKTLRADRVLAVRQISDGHAAHLRVMPNYHTLLPAFPVAKAVFRVPQTANASRTWGVDLNAYTCTCPEGRVRRGMGYVPGQLGFCCPHMAKAIREHLPADAAWPDDVVAFLAHPVKTSIGALS